MKDSQVDKLIAKEERRQKAVVNLIASENVSSQAVRRALASAFADKYAEGYPGNRFYAGNAVVDELETLARSRALALFGLASKRWSVNVQPLSGSPANLAVLSGLVAPRGKVMGMRLRDGGHLTHGAPASLSGKLWTPVPYGVDTKTGRIDYDALEEIATRERPEVVIAGFTAYPRAVDWKRFRRIADAAGALLVADVSHLAGLIAGKAYPSPFPYADVVVTTTHKTLRGPRGAIIFSRKDSRAIPERIDKAVFPGLQGGPHMNQVAAIAVALREAATPTFRTYAKAVVENARTLSAELSRLGWRVVTGGTDSHLLLLDVWMGGRGPSGKVAQAILEEAGIIVNMNAIPGDSRGVLDPSGIRLGTAYETSRGMKKRDFRGLARRIDAVLREHAHGITR